MKYLKLIFLISFINIFVFSQQEYQKIDPSIKSDRSFAIIIDNITFSKLGNLIKEYKSEVEKQNISTFILSADWKNPEQIKSKILELFKNQNLEGIVLIGDIPIPMIRDGQHLTSAFKMDQSRYPFIRSSIPSDRFYDDFDLKFEFLKQDSINNKIFYYSLTFDSPVCLEKEIYSARIKSTLNGGEKYSQLEKYFNKLLKIKHENNKLNKFFYACSEGYVSDSYDAFMDESERFTDGMNNLKKSDGSFTKMFFELEKASYKDKILQNLKEDDLDLALITAHGEPNYQYLKSIPPKDTSKAEKEKAFNQGHILVEDVKKNNIGTRVMVSNSCFNGAFINLPYLAGEYIFSDGNCVVSCANSVNILQDIWTLEDISLLQYGKEIGLWHRKNSYLESHLFGDPTFRYFSEDDSEFNKLINNKINNSDLLEIARNNKILIKRSLALENLYKNKYEKLSNLLIELYKIENSSEVRTKILKIMCKLKDENLEKILLLSMNDPNEFIRRVSVKILGEIGKEEYIPALAKSFSWDQSERVRYSAENSLSRINPKKSEDFMNELIKNNPELEKDSILLLKVKYSFKSKINLFSETVKIIGENNLKKKLSELKSLRGNRTSKATDLLLNIVENKSDPKELKITALEALGWYCYQNNWKNIIERLEKIKNEKGYDKSLLNNLNFAIKRLETVPNHPLTP